MSDGIGPCPHGDLWSYDIYNNIWTDITPFDRTISAHRGGYVSPWQHGAPRRRRFRSRAAIRCLERRSLDGFFSWTELTQVNHGPLGIYRRAWHDMTAANDEYYVFGGFGVEGALSDLWKFSPERVDALRAMISDYIDD